MQDRPLRGPLALGLRAKKNPGTKDRPGPTHRTAKNSSAHSALRLASSRPQPLRHGAGPFPASAKCRPSPPRTKKKRRPRIIRAALEVKKKARQLPTFPRAKRSIIGVRELDFRVRNGNGYCLSTMATGHLFLSLSLSCPMPLAAGGPESFLHFLPEKTSSPDGTNNMVKPHDLLVMLG